MTRAATAESYARRLERVDAHIAANLDARLDLDALAEIACFSPFHFHRIYRAVTGETTAETVTRLRLERAAHQLLTTSSPIVEIAQAAGYGSAAAFGRAFSAAYATTPVAFRDHRNPGRRLPSPRPRAQDASTMPVVIQDRPPTRIAFVPHRGPYNEIGAAFKRLYAWAIPRGVARDALGVAVFLDDVRTVAPEDLRSQAGLTVGPKVAGGDEVTVREIPGGRHAMLLYKGPYAGLFAAWSELRGWLTTSGEQAADAPGFEIYLNDPYDTAPADLLTELYRPLR